MTGSCQFSFGKLSGAATWTYDGASLTVTPKRGGPLAFALRESVGISGDDYTLSILWPATSGGGSPGAVGGAESAELLLTRLGHDGPTLAEALRRDWLRARTEVLRLGGSGESWLVAGQVSGLDGEEPESCRALLFEDVLVVGREGRDLEPVFLALLDTVTFDEASYTVEVDEWPGRRLVFSKLAKQTDEFVQRLETSRALMAEETATTLVSAVPGLPSGGRAALAGVWLPGRLMQLAEMEKICPGFGMALCDGWLSNVRHQEECMYLLDWALPEDTWVGCTREKDAPAGLDARSGDDEIGQRPLWMLAGKDDVWFLEPLSIEDHAAYCFKGGDEIPALVSRLLCAPQFSREALFSPMADLTGDRASLATPAGHLGFLIQLRERFQARVIHHSLDAWRQEVERLSQS